LVRDLSAEGNLLPDDLKQNLIDLGFWAMRYGSLAVSQTLSLEPLIAVNRNIMDGLRAQVASVAHPAVEPVVAPPTGQHFIASA
jgi:flagellar protein FlaF